MKKNIFAAVMFFTRLPLWRFKSFQLSEEYFKPVISYWAVVSWLTSGVMVVTLWLASMVFPMSVAICLALLSRLFLTGAFHEDGLADFFDGFGGGVNKQRILEIMKDSHIGTYGVLALVFYFLFSIQILQNIPLDMLYIAFIVADSFSKLLVSTLTFFLPYARTKDTSKAGVVYDKMNRRAFIISSFFGLLPLFLLPHFSYLLILILPVSLFLFLKRFIRKKIEGFTGDTCGALFLMCEFSIWLVFLAFIGNF